MSKVVRHDLDFYPKAPSGGRLHEVLLWETFANGTRKMVESGYGADDAQALGDLLNRLAESGHADSMIRSVRESYVTRAADQDGLAIVVRVEDTPAPAGARE
jgi:hypothetical protein